MGKSPSTIYKIVGLKNEKIPIKDTVGFCTNRYGLNLCYFNTFKLIFDIRIFQHFCLKTELHIEKLNNWSFGLNKNQNL